MPLQQKNGGKVKWTLGCAATGTARSGYMARNGLMFRRLHAAAQRTNMHIRHTGPLQR